MFFKNLKQNESISQNGMDSDQDTPKIRQPFEKRSCIFSYENIQFLRKLRKRLSYCDSGKKKMDQQLKSGNLNSLLKLASEDKIIQNPITRAKIQLLIKSHEKQVGNTAVDHSSKQTSLTNHSNQLIDANQQQITWKSYRVIEKQNAKKVLTSLTRIFQN